MITGTWFSDEVEKKLEESAWNCATHLTASMMEYMQEEVSEPYPPASSPNNPPHKRSGDLQDGFFIVGHPEEHKHTLGNSVPYATYLELGTYKMAPRPFMMPAILWCQQNAKSLLEELRVN